jgi:HlyD family secretion protein
MRGKWLLIGGTSVFLAIAAAALLVWHERRSPAVDASAPETPNVATPLGEISIAGRIHARDIVFVEPGVSGQIEEFHAEVGDEVFEGQLLARISNQGLESAGESAQAAVETAQERVNKLESAIIAARLEASRARADASRARGELDRADKVYRRQRMLHAEGATPRLVYEKAETEFQNAKIEADSLNELAKQAEERVQQIVRDLEAAKRLLSERSSQLEEVQADLRDEEVRSPVNGMVVSREGEIGEQVDTGPEAHLFGIAVNLLNLDVLIEPEPPVLERIEAGQPALVFVADVPEGLDGVVREVGASHATVEFTSPNPLVKPGMTAQVRLKLEL